MRYLMCFSYDGSKFNGYQKQPSLYTVQDVIEEKLTIINSNKKVSISASGRTDKGVHAYNQYAHFDLDKIIDLDLLKHSLNKMLPDSIYIKNIMNVSSDFHARFNVIKKEYIYKINVGEFNPMDNDYIYQYCDKLDVDLMKLATKYFIGEHNFKSYTKGCEEKETYIRNIFDVKIEENNNIIHISFIGNGFMRYMVRNMVGSLIEVGSKKIEPTKIKEIIEDEDRTSSGICAPACGLYLANVYYED